MSYCRSGKDSDVYCYGVHNNSIVDDPKYSMIYCTHISINVKSPFDGASFQDYTLEDFKQRLLSLREYNIKIPQFTLDRIEKEITKRIGQ